MSADGNKAVVNDFVDAVWRRGEIGRLGEFWTDDCINHAALGPDETGLASLRRYHEQFGSAFAGFSEMNIGVVQQVADASKVVTHMETRLKHTGLFNGIAATGRTVMLASMRIDRIKNGKIAEHWSIGDLAGLMLQLQT